MNRLLQFCISNKNIFRVLFLVFILNVSFVWIELYAQTFTNGNLTVLKIGDGTTSMVGGAAMPDSVIEYTTSGARTGTYIGLPTGGTDKITNSGAAISEGYMSLSAERDQLVLVGYDAVPGTAAVVSTPASVVNRVLFSIKSGGAVTKVTYTNSDYSGNNIRSGTSYGTNYFSSGTSPGLESMISGTVLTTNPTNTRVIQIFNGQTYFTSAAAPFGGVSKLGTGIPTTAGQTSTLVVTDTSSPFGFAISPDGNILYLADESIGITKYTLSGGVFVSSYVLNTTHSRGLTADFSGTNPIIYATTDEITGNKIIKITDAGGPAIASPIATAQANTVFRGITFSPSCFASIALTTPSVTCAGDSSTLVIKGNPYGLVHYNINGGPTQSVTIGNNGQATIHTGSLTVTSTFHLMDINTPSCSAAPISGSVTVTVNPAPAAIGGGSSVCLPNSITLTNTTTGGTWSSTNTSVAIIGSLSGILSGVVTGSSIITYKLSTGCFTSTNISVLSSPTPLSGIGDLCVGASLTAANTIAGGIWSSSTTAVSVVGSGTGVVTGVGPGTANITYTLPNGCFKSRTMSVSSNPAPISGASSVCVGFNTTLTDAGGGVWASTNTSVATIGGMSGILTGVSTGTCIITYGLVTGCYITTTFTVNPNPAGISGLTGVCQGSNASLSNSVPGGGWSSSNAAIASIGSGSGVVTGIGSGTSIISYTLPTGCYSTTTFRVNPAPTAITGPASVCVGSTVSVSNTIAGGLWSSGNSAVATIGSTLPLVTGVSAGTTIITYSLSNGCYSTLVFQVNTAPSAVLGVSSICLGNSSVYTNIVSGGLWSSGNTSVATIGSTGGLLNSVSAGTTIITYQLGNGCRSVKTISVNPLPSAISGPGAVCSGANITLSGSGTGTWTGSNSLVATVGSSTGIVTGIIPGSTIVTYTISTGCSITTTVNVLLAPTAITGSASLCLFASTSLSGSGAGAWSSSNTGIALVGSLSGIVSGVSVGTANITYALANGCFATIQETVKPVPASITGPASVCAGSVITLSTISTGGVWSSSNASLALIGSSTGVVTGIISGAVVITYTLPSGCYKTTNLVVNPIPSPISGATELCVGSSTTLTGPGGGLWSSSNLSSISIGSSTGIATGVMAGSAIITYTLATGCVTTWVLNANPLPFSIAGPTQVCINSSITLTDASTGGTWLSQNPAQASVGNLSGIVTGLTYGTVGISYILPTGCFTFIVMDVEPIPAPITGLLSVCVGASTTLVDFGGGTWSSSAPAIATIGSVTGLVNGISTGTSLITYRLITGCYVDTLITVNPSVPAISGDSVVCVGQTTTLTDIGGGSWSSSNVAIADIGASSGVVTGLIAGTSMITYQLPTGCFNTKEVIVNPAPSMIVGADSICMGTNTVFHDSISGGVWNSSDRTIAGIDSTSGIVIGFAPGNVNITYTLPTGCRITKPFTVNLSPLPISGVWSLCLGEITTLSDPTIGGTWSSSNTSVATIDPVSGSIHGLTLGTSTITYQLPTGCYTTAIYRINPFPGVISGTTQLCEGASSILTDTTGGTWTSSNIAIATIDAGTGLLTGVSAGTVIITYAFGPGCYSTIGATINPNPPAITGGTNLCVANTITLGNSISGGIWSSSNSLVATIGSTTGIVTGVASGTTGITYILSTGCKNNITLTVNPLPVAGVITGNTSLCLGTTSQLADAAPGGIWSISDTNIASISNTGLLTARQAGTDTVYYKVTNSCGTAIAKVAIATYRGADSVHINIAPSTQPCTGTRYQNFGTTVPQPAGMLYTWSANNAEIWVVSSDRQNCLVNFNTPGISFIKLTVSAGSSQCASTDSLGYYTGEDIVPIYNVLYFNNHFICTGYMADGYQWGYDDMTTLDSSIITGEVNQNYYNTHPEFISRYYWVMTSFNGCMQKSYYNGPMAVANNLKDETAFTVYPNPVENVLNVKVPNAQMYDKVDVKIVDVLGKEVNNISFNGNAGFCNFADFKAGVYLAIISKNGERVGVRAFVKR